MKKSIHEWANALRSKNYKQGRGKLVHNNQYGKRHCCLGVLEDICEVSSGYKASMPKFAPSLLLTDYKDRSGFEVQFDALAHLNDDGVSFDDIADFIEKKISAQDLVDKYNLSVTTIFLLNSRLINLTI